MDSIRLQSIRGVACFLVVYFHVVGTDFSGMKLSYDSFYRQVSYLFEFIRMPLFTFLSGYVYGLRRFRGGINDFVKGKFKRLILPLVFVGFVFFLVQSFVPGINSGEGFIWFKYLYLPYAHFWFIQAIFIVFLIVCLVEKVLSYNGDFLLVIYFISVFLFFKSYLFTEYFSIDRVFYLLPFFLMGFISKVYGLYRIRVEILFILILVFVFMMLLHYFNYLEGEEIDRLSWLSLFIGCFAPIILMNIRIDSKWLAYIGGFSYSIYLYHVFATAGMRVVLNKLMINDEFVHVSLGVISGIVFPILVHSTFKEKGLVSFMFLGTNKKR